jgi:tetratricopeptide (TPR) repeat protein
LPSLASYADDAFDKLMIAAGKYADAVKYAEDNIPVGSRDAGVWSKMGVAYEKQDFNEKALACYMVSMRSGKSMKPILARPGSITISSSRKPPLTWPKKPWSFKPTGDASWEYARACIALGKSGEAKAALEKVVEVDPTNVVANRELGLIYYKANDYQRALSLLKVAMKNGGATDIAVMLATAFKSQGQLDSAVAYLKIAAQDPKDPGFRLARTCAYQLPAGAVPSLASMPTIKPTSRRWTRPTSINTPSVWKKAVPAKMIA